MRKPPDQMDPGRIFWIQGRIIDVDLNVVLNLGLDLGLDLGLNLDML